MLGSLTDGAVGLDVAQVALVQEPHRHVAHVPRPDAVVGLQSNYSTRPLKTCSSFFGQSTFSRLHGDRTGLGAVTVSDAI